MNKRYRTRRSGASSSQIWIRGLTEPAVQLSPEGALVHFSLQDFLNERGASFASRNEMNERYCSSVVFIRMNLSTDGTSHDPFHVSNGNAGPKSQVP